MTDTKSEVTERVVYRKSGGGFTDYGGVLSCQMHWDEFGAYLGQEQLNCMDEDPDAPLILFFKAQGNQAGEFGLTEREMENAIDDPYTFHNLGTNHD